MLPELEPNNLPVVELTLSPGTRIDGSILQQPDGKVILTAPQAKLTGRRISPVPPPSKTGRILALGCSGILPSINLVITV